MIEHDEIIKDKDCEIRTLSIKIEAFEKLKFRLDEDKEKKFNRFYKVGIINNWGNLVERRESLSFKSNLEVIHKNYIHIEIW